MSPSERHLLWKPSSLQHRHPIRLSTTDRIMLSRSLREQCERSMLEGKDRLFAGIAFAVPVPGMIRQG
jgi:hypothetical protein